MTSETTKEIMQRFLSKLGSGRLFMVVGIVLTFCVSAILLILSKKPTVEAMAVFGTVSTLATSIGKDYFNRNRNQ